MRYPLYGGVLESELELPGLPEGDTGALATWTLRTEPFVVDESECTLLGEEELVGGVRARLLRDAREFILRFDDTGDFRVSNDGAQLAWSPRDGADHELVVSDVLNRALPLALHIAGVLSLHGSAVAIGEAGVAFLAPKLHGKSTLAQALLRTGARLLTDDVVAIRLGETVTMEQGVPQARLWDDSVERLDAAVARTELASGKRLLHVPVAIAPHAIPCSALYILAPRPAHDDIDAVHRVALGPAESAFAVLPHTRLGALMSGAEAGRLLQRCAALVRAVPVYRLDVVRDFARLEEVAATIAGWHAPVSQPARAGIAGPGSVAGR